VFVCVCVCVLCVRMSVHSALYTCQVVQQTGEQHRCKLLGWVYDADDGDGDDELKVHSKMCVHECARCAVDLPSWPANWTAPLGSTTASTTGQHYYHHWTAPLANTTGQLHRAAPLVSTTGKHHWPALLTPRTMLNKCKFSTFRDLEISRLKIYRFWASPQPSLA
jgi:hypothetical protein